jgi:hypothetical protein
MLIFFLLACAPAPLPFLDDTSEPPVQDTGTPPSIGPCSRWLGDWDAELDCGGTGIGIPDTGTATITAGCSVVLSVATIGTDGSCRLTEAMLLTESGEDAFSGQTTEASTDPYDCDDRPAILPFDLGGVSIATGPDAVTLSFSGQLPWVFGDCTVADAVLTPSSGTASR